MSRADADLDARLRALDPSPSGERTGVSATPWAVAARERIVRGAPPPRGAPPARRMPSALAAGAALVAAFVLVGVLLVATRPGPSDEATGDAVALVAAPLDGGTVDASSLSVAAGLMERRAGLVGLAGVAAVPRGQDGLDLTVPRGTPAATVDALIAPGRLAILSWRRALAGGPFGTREAAERFASRRGGDLTVVAQPLIVAGGGGRGQYYVLRNAPALTDADVGRARVAPGPDPGVRISLTPAGIAAFRALTRDIARQGRALGRPQMVVIVLDRVLLSNPIVDHRRYPRGLDGSAGLWFPASSQTRAAAVAAELSAGPLPIRLARR